MKSYFYCGHNVFGQISKCEEEIAIFTPRKIHVQSSNSDSDTSNNKADDGSTASKQVWIGWDKLFVSKDSRCINIQGFHQGIKVIRCENAVKHIAASIQKTYVLTENKCYQFIEQRLEELPQCIVRQIDCGETHTVALTEGGNLYEIQDLKYIPAQIPLHLSTQEITTVSCGKEHVIILVKSGNVLTFGGGSRGQLGHGDNEFIEQPRHVEALGGVHVSAISAGGWHSAVVSSIGDIYIWGWNEAGQLGLPCKNIGRLNSVDTSTLANRRDDISQTGGFKFHVPEINIQTLPFLLDLPEEPTIMTVACGSRHTAAVSDAGNLLTWGWNQYGQLCHGDLLSRDQPCLVQFFREKQLKVADVDCKFWSTVVTVCESV